MATVNPAIARYVCESSADAQQPQVLAVSLSVVFGLYVGIAMILAFFAIRTSSFTTSASTTFDKSTS